MRKRDFFCYHINNVIISDEIKERWAYWWPNIHLLSGLSSMMHSGKYFFFPFFFFHFQRITMLKTYFTDAFRWFEKGKLLLSFEFFFVYVIFGNVVEFYWNEKGIINVYLKNVFCHPSCSRSFSLQSQAIDVIQFDFHH